VKTPANLLDLDAQLCFALYSSSLAMTKAYKPLLAELGLTYPQYLVMLALWQHGNQGVGELGERLYLDSGTLTPLCKRLETMGLLQRRRAEHDERHVEVSMTAAGKRLRAKAEALPLCILQISGCDIATIQSFTRELQGLRDRLVARMAAEPAPSLTA